MLQVEVVAVRDGIAEDDLLRYLGREVGRNYLHPGLARHPRRGT